VTGETPAGPVPIPGKPSSTSSSGADADFASNQIIVSDAGSLDRATILTLVRQEFIYALAGLVIGAAAFGGGAAMIVFTHSTGAVDLQITVGSTELHIVTVVVGLVIALFGVMIIRMTRPSIKLDSTNNGITAVKNRQ
jgi:hypothetical protein